ncbi:MAG: DNA topoisomerase 2 [Caeruleum heppii]|nr:MAG: DNA topoisomerase 2 [Caeruleum heppii]
MEDSVFDDGGASSDHFSPVEAAKTKAKAAPKKTAAKPKAAPKAASKKTTQQTLKMKAVVPKKRSKPDPEDEPSDRERASEHDDSLLASTPPSAKKQKKARAPKKSGGKPLQDIENIDSLLDGTDEPDAKPVSGATEQYQKLTQLEHILKRPDTYIGSVERTEREMWVFNSETESIEMRNVSFVPGLYKIFDEILVNAADNKQRDKNMDTIKVTVNREKGEISVMNNGRGIPIEIHQKDKIYIPEMIFGHLLTSSNYNDDQQKVTGGRNGYGAKLCNIFSTEFVLETADSKSKQKYKQIWTANMSKMGKAKITSNKSDDYTKVTFTPDFTKFGMDGMDDDFEALVKRRVYDMAGTNKGVKVFLNGEKVKIRDFKQYMEMYVKAINKGKAELGTVEPSTMTILTEQPDVRWEIGFAVSDGSFQQVSFVNSIATTSGGTHVNYIGDQIVNKLADIIKKRKDKTGVILKNNQIRNYMFLFVNCLVVNPAFTSQTKEQLTTKASQFGSKCTVTEEFMKKVGKTQIVNNVLHFAQQKADLVLKRSDGHKRSRINNPKLTDANKAGTKDGWKCTLILTEGESAKGLAIAGRSVVGADEFGVFPLRGKLLNVRDASIEQISKNSEIQSLKQFIGLQHKKEYTDTKGLRYGHIMIMTDQDHDGSHIKGLLINFLQCAFPSLLRIPQFLIEFITPIVKVWKGNPKNPTKWKSFFTMPEYEAWAEEHQHERGWDHKYYKGLGTSSTEDAQVYFRDLDRHLKEFHTMQEEEVKLIELAFSKKKAEERKEWLRQFKPGTYLDHSIDKISYTDFINKELILFSMADNMRSIPSVMDGLKPGQRKVLYACFKRNLKKDVKVVELAGSVMSMTAYHHGEASVQQTIVGLAQTFVGSNNINCLEPSGNFGSRLSGGSDCASARYIFTRLSPFARRIFSPLDDPLLKYNVDDNKQIEPEMYCPVVPMVLINGADGIGTGWSSSIPNYNPEDVVDNLRRLLDKQEQVPMSPWFRGWDGDVKQIAPDRYKFSGKIKQTGDNEVEITELPIRVWTQDFKDKLEDIIKAEKIPSFIKDYTDYNTHLKVHFIVQMEDKHMKLALEEGLEERFKLSKTIATSNLVAFDTEGRLTKYESPEHIMEEFFRHRYKLYEQRKAYQLAELHKEHERMTNQARFIQMIIDGKLVVSKKKKSDLIEELKKKGFKAIPKVKDASKAGEAEAVVENEEDEDDVMTSASDYDYLLGMAIWSLTKERIDKLLRQVGDTEAEIDRLIKLSVKDIWSQELEDFITEWRSELDDEHKRQKKVANLGRRASSKLKVGAKGPAARRRKAMGDDPDDSDFDFATTKTKKSGPAKAVKADPKAASAFFGQFARPLKDEPTETKPALAAARSTLNGTKKPVKAAAKAAAAAADEMKLDRTSDAMSEEDGMVGLDNKTTKRSRAPITSTKANESSSETLQAHNSPMRRPRAAANRSVKYGDDSDSDSDNGDDLLGDVSNMVKGIGDSMSGGKPGSRPLFSTSLSRPGSSAGLPKVKSRAASKHVPVASEDETDFSKLVPQSARQKSVMDEELVEHDDTFSFSADQPLPKTTRREAGKGAVPAKAAPKVTKPVAKKVAGSSAAAKKSQLSPAAKAYAAKQGKKKVAESESEADEVQAMADDLLDSPGKSTQEIESSPARPAGTRPARRAVATKKKAVYVDSDSVDVDSDGDGVGSADYSESE